MKVIIILPTYNERSNIEHLVPIIFSLEIPHLHILVVDDNSPDDTGEVVEKMKMQYPNLSIIHCEKI